MMPAMELDDAEALARLWSTCPHEMAAVVARWRAVFAAESKKIFAGENDDFSVGAAGRLADIADETERAPELVGVLRAKLKRRGI